MHTVKKLFKNHAAAVLLALFFSVVVAAPQVYFRIDNREMLKDGVQSIELIPDSPWSARAREVMDGHPWFGNIYNKDGKDNPYLFQPLGSMVVAYSGMAFGLDINDTILLSRLVYSFVVFMLFYGFVYLLSRDKFAALSASAVLLFADSVLSAFGISQVLHGLSPDYFVRMARPVNPAMIYVFFIGFLIPFWLFYRTRRWQWGAVSAVVLGLNFYNYFYTWTYLYAFGGILALSFLIQKNWREAVRLGSVFVGALPIALLYIVNLHEVTLHPAYEEVGARFGMVYTHGPLFIGVTALAGIIIFLIGFPREDRSRYLFALALALAPIVTMNQQIITGKVLQPAHYHWFFHKPIAVILVTIVLFHLVGRFAGDFYKKMLAILIVSVSIIVGVFTQVESYQHDRRDGIDITMERQKYGPVMDWLNENVAKETMVFGNNESSHLVVIYTPLNVYYHRAAPFASLSATKARQYETLFAFYRLEGLGSADVRERFFADRVRISGEIYGIYYRELFGSYEAIPDDKIEEAIAEYLKALETPADIWLENSFRKYEVEYIVWDTRVDPLWQLNKYPFLEEVATLGTMKIYHVVPKQ